MDELLKKHNITDFHIQTKIDKTTYTSQMKFMKDLNLVDLSLYPNPALIPTNGVPHIYIYDRARSRKDFFFKVGEMNKIGRPLNTLKNAGNYDADDVEMNLLAVFPAVMADGVTTFSDHALHNALRQVGIINRKVKYVTSREWYGGVLNNGIQTNINLLLTIAKHFINDNIQNFDLLRNKDYTLLPDQKRITTESTDLINTYNETGNFREALELLWNVKTRGGKSFMTGTVIQSTNARMVLIATYMPAVEESWQAEFAEHVNFKNIVFLSNANEMDEFKLDKLHSYPDKIIVAFVSYQDLLGKKDKVSTIKDKHIELFDTQFDMIIIDEFHHGASSKNAKGINDIDSEEEYDKEAIEFEYNIKTLKTNVFLNLTGTAFQALAIQRFKPEHTWHYSYLDEQSAKESWIPSLEYPTNPLEMMPKINIMMVDTNNALLETLAKTPEFLGRNEFSLSKMFKVYNGEFIRPKYVEGFLNLISGISQTNSMLLDDEKITPQPYSTSHPIKDVDVDHVPWLFNDVEACNTMEKSLNNHVVFKDYIIINIAGKNGFSGNKTAKYTKRLIAEAIRKNKRTITLTAGKLTTGVTFPEWYTLFNLKDGTAINLYFQYLGRAQTPHVKNHKIKKVCHLFDFNPNRCLTLYNQYACALLDMNALNPKDKEPINDNNESPLTKTVKKLQLFMPIISVANNKYVKLNTIDIMTFKYDGIPASIIGRNFSSKKLLNNDNDIWDALLNDTTAMKILENTKMFRLMKKESKIEFQISSSNIKAPTEDDFNPTQVTPKEKAKLDPEVLAYNKKKSHAQEICISIISRLATHLTITVTDEHTLSDIIDNANVEDQKTLSETVGIDFADFKYLFLCDTFNQENLDTIILKHLQMDEATIESTNRFFTTNHKLI